MFPWTLEDQSLRVVMRADSALGVVLLNGSNQEVPQGNNRVSREKHLTQVTAVIESSHRSYRRVSLRCYPPPTVISEQNKRMTSVRKERRKRKMCSQLHDSDTLKNKCCVFEEEGLMETATTDE